MNRQTENLSLSLILSVERIGLVARYALAFLLAPFLWDAWQKSNSINLGIGIAIILVHNAYVHWAFRFRRYEFFLSPFNFAAYLVEATILTAVTGADSSDAYILYFLLLIGFGTYHRRLGGTVVAALLCCIAYGGVLYGQWLYEGLSEAPANLGGRFLFMLVCAWLTGSLSSQLRRSETSLKSHTEALSASEATLRTILDNAAEPILVYDEREFIIEANDRAREFLGLARDQLIGRRIRSFMFDDGTLPNKFASLRARGEYHGEIILVKADGEERTVDFRVRSFIREGERFFVAVANDITEQKNLQEATRLANANLERLNRELRSVDQLKTGFLVSISQKLRTPLSAVLGFLEMLLQEELGEINPDQRNALQTSRRATLRVFRLIDEALELRYRDKPVVLPDAPNRNPQDHTQPTQTK